MNKLLNMKMIKNNQSIKEKVYTGKINNNINYNKNKNNSGIFNKIYKYLNKDVN
jgi:hypothetical protein